VRGDEQTLAPDETELAGSERASHPASQPTRLASILERNVTCHTNSPIEHPLAINVLTPANGVSGIGAAIVVLCQRLQV